MTAQASPTAPSERTEHFDVLIIGAGISGIGGAYHLSKQRPEKSFLILDAQESFGGTWWTHRYPGIRSDSDLHTFGYRFKPWKGPPIATAAEILAYMGEVIAENDLARHIRYRYRVLSAAWSSRDKLWRIMARPTHGGDELTITAKFLWMCQGYYRQSQGYMPNWPAIDSFKGRLVHAETWPEDLDCGGRKVVVIGSGATAATLIPAIADACGHVTMLQRSPTFFITGRNVNDLAETLQIDEAWIHEIVRRKVLYDQAAFTRRCLAEPDAVADELIGMVRSHLGCEYDVDKHFTPRYRPWRQRIAFIPDADLFKAIKEGKASVVTDEIERFVPSGILLRSGTRLDADVIVAATGFNINVLGDIAFSVDGRPLVFADSVTYRGMMFTGLPNLAWVFGYFRASWTLRADLVADFVCRLLGHMDSIGARKVTVALRPQDRDMPLLSWVDPESFNPGYILRAMHLLPKRGDKPEWQHSQDYWSEKDQFAAIDLGDAAFVYE
jgi:cation diffusion facilitator CzcD-associated flavoprotein CzcO